MTMPHASRFTVFENYLFKGRAGVMLLALGAASLFNHSRTPNMDYRIDHSNKVHALLHLS